MDSNSVWLALALVLIIQGLFPFLHPVGWRKAFEQVLKMSDGQVRFSCLCCVVLGTLAIAFLS